MAAITPIALQAPPQAAVGGAISKAYRVQVPVLRQRGGVVSVGKARKHGLSARASDRNKEEVSTFEAAQKAADVVEDTITNLLGGAGKKAQQAGDAVGKRASAVEGKVEQAVGETVDTVGDGANLASRKAGETLRAGKEKAQEMGESAEHGAKKLGSKAESKVKEVGHETGEAAKDLGNKAERKTREAGHEVGGALEDAGHEAKGAARDVKHDVQRGTDKAGYKADKLGHKVGEAGRDVQGQADRSTDKLADLANENKAKLEGAGRDFSEDASRDSKQWTESSDDKWSDPVPKDGVSEDLAGGVDEVVHQLKDTANEGKSSQGSGPDFSKDATRDEKEWTETGGKFSDPVPKDGSSGKYPAGAAKDEVVHQLKDTANEGQSSEATGRNFSGDATRDDKEWTETPGKFSDPVPKDGAK